MDTNFSKLGSNDQISIIHVEANSTRPSLTIFHSSSTLFKRDNFLKISSLVKMCLIKTHAKFGWIIVQLSDL